METEVARRSTSLLLWLPLVACSAPDEPLRLALRFLEEEPTAIVDASNLLDSHSVFLWARSDTRCAQIWPESEAATSPLDGIVSVSWSLDRVMLVLAKRPPGTVVDGVEMELRSLSERDTRTGRALLQWADGAGRFGGQRSAREPHGELDESGARRYRLTRKDGRLDARVGLRLVVLPPNGSRIGICSVRGISEKYDPAGVARIDGCCKVSLGGQYRSAIPALRDNRLERALLVPRSAELRFAYGLLEGADSAVGFEVLLIDDEDGEVQRFDHVLTPGEAGVWHEARVSLATFGGRRVVVRLETDPADALAGRGSAAFWAHPEIVYP
jgi:hypothetical protein